MSALSARAAFAPTLLDHLSTAVLWLRPDFRILYLNPAAEELLALSRQPADDRPLPERLPEARALAASLERARATAELLTHRELVIPLPGEPARAVTVDATLTPLLDVPGAPPELLLELVALDRHLLISREEALVARQDAQRALLRGLAHEIRNPLGGLRGAAQLLEQELAGSPLAEYTRVIVAEADRLRDLVDALLGPVRPPRRVRVNVHEVCERVRALLAAERPAGPALARDYDPSLPELDGDPDQLVQVLLNLARNACEAAGPRGRITLRTRALRQYTIRGTRYRLALRLDVEDDGPGVPPALADSLFLPLVSGRPDGTGLGLAIAQELVQRHGGLIEWTSVPGRTVFSVILPLGGDNGEGRHASLDRR